MTQQLLRDQTADGGMPREVAPAVTDTAGRAFAALFRLLKVARPDRPIHPKGRGLAGKVTRTGTSGEPSGLDWLDAPGIDPVVARFSRSAGLPQTLPDVLGLALRVTPSRNSVSGTTLDAGADGGAAGGGSDGSGPDGAADILFASTGWQLPGRFLLQPRLDVSSATFTTLMPYRGRKGPVLLGLRSLSLPAGSITDGEWVLGLYWAKPAGPWRQCGELRLRASPEPADTPLRFNPLENQPPGAQAYDWTRRLRERSYQAAQQTPPPAVAHSAAAPPPKGNHSSPATPGRNTMSTVSQLFNTPAADVWRVIADGWLYSGWVVGASRIRAVDDTWPQAGARLHHSVGAWPLLINDSTRVTAVEPGKSLELVARGWPMGEARIVITLQDQGSQCLVTIAEDAIRGPGKKVPKVMRDPMITVRNRETLKRLELMAAGGAGR
ncbi:SRPBCC family protein [Pseudarthrobacter sp. R1]|uniref:SRPBCC family protein n=1 Tax=Pseudarthrobacter sp. R1 TaxID=2944934 RepID=UPI00210EEEEC|nr:SRPBCC family protein [Pseudarthrobacter sp. R1]MCQ6271241.1 SRPBCC family protein [Pseudarthrobacter sp. R1]